MWEIDMEMEEDSWSLIAIVKECARKVQCRALDDQDAQNTTITPTTEPTTVVVQTDNNRPNPFSDDFGGGGDNSVQVGVSDKNSVEIDNQQNPFFDELIESFQIGVSGNNSVETDNNQLIPFLYQLVSSDNNLAQIGVSDNNSIENPIILDQNDASYNIPSQNPSTFSDQIDAGSNNFLQIPPPFSIQNDDSKNYSLQNPSPFSNQVDASKNYSLQNPSPFSNQVDASKNYTLQNPSPFSNQVDASNNNFLQNPPPFSIQNYASNNSLQNPSPFSIQNVASSNSLQNPSPFSIQNVASNNSLQNPSPFFNQVNASSNSLQNPSPFFNQVNASNNNSLQIPSPFSNQVNASSNSLQNPSPFFNQVNASSNSLQNPSPFFNEVNASNNNTLQIPSPFSNQTVTSNNSLQIPSPFSNQVVTSNNNSLQNPSPFSNQKDASTRDWVVPLPRTGGRSSCGHHFMDLFQPLLMAPQNNPNPNPNPNPNHNSTKEVHPLQDFNTVPPFTANTQRDPALYRFPQRKRKFETNRRVYRVTLEELSKNDKWAWRKYGQKPIKGSPYPRNYYKCSSNKECMAKKQVERSPIEPESYLVTYTGEHFHPHPAYRSHGGHRVRKSVLVSSSIEENNESPTSTMATHLSGGLSGSGENVVVMDGAEDGGAGAEAGADDCGDSEAEGSNYDGILVPNPMADMNFENADGYGYGYGHGYGNETEKIEYDPVVNTGVRGEGTSGGVN